MADNRVYLLHGENTFQSFETLRKLTEAKKYLTLEGKNFDLKTFAEQWNNLSLFEDSQPLVIRGLLTNKPVASTIEAIIHLLEKRQSERLVIFYESKKIESANVLFKWMVKRGTVSYFAPFNVFQLKKWIKERVSQKGFVMEEPAIDLLLENNSGEMWELSNELQKLMLYRSREKQIRLSDISPSSFQIKYTDMFDLGDALGERNTAASFRLLNQMLVSGTAPSHIIATLSGHMRRLIELKSLSVAGLKASAIEKKVSMKIYSIQKILHQAGKFSLEELQSAYCLLILYDSRIKKGMIDANQALNLWADGMCSKRP